MSASVRKRTPRMSASDPKRTYSTLHVELSNGKIFYSLKRLMSSLRLRGKNTSKCDRIRRWATGHRHRSPIDPPHLPWSSLMHCSKV